MNYLQFSLAPTTGLPSPQVALAGFVITGISMMQDTVPVGTRWLDISIGYGMNRECKLKILNGPDILEIQEIENSFSCNVDSPVPLLNIGVSLRGYYRNNAHNNREV